MDSDKKRPESPYSELGQALLRLRTERGWSLRKAAGLIGDIKHSRLQDFERAADPHSARPTRPSEGQLRRIAKVYGTDPLPLLRLAGYSCVGPLEPWEEDLVLKARQLSPKQRAALVAALNEWSASDEDA